MPKPKRSVIKKIPSPRPDLYADVDVYDTTLEHMLESKHVEEHARIDEVYECVSDPDSIFKSADPARDNHFLLVSDKVVSANSKDKLRVVVKNVSPAEAIFVTAYFASGATGPLVWAKGVNEGETNG